MLAKGICIGQSGFAGNGLGADAVRGNGNLNLGQQYIGFHTVIVTHIRFEFD